MTPEIVSAIARRLADHAGLELPAWVIEARVRARSAVLGITHPEYVALISAQHGARELHELIESVRVGESRLFRHRSQIAALVDVVVPALRAKGKRSVRVWSAGCAAGEEPYTLAAVLSRAMPGATVSIIATDVSADALEAAARAAYPASAWSDIPDDWRGAFEQVGDVVRVRPEVQKLVKFEQTNLVESAATMPRSCDIVWCRNVLIYFTPAARKRVIERLVAATNPGGVVFVGYSESLRDIAELEPLRAGEVVYYARREHARAPTPSAGLAGLAKTPAVGIPKLASPDVDRSAPMLMREQPIEDVLVLRGIPTTRAVTAELTARLAITGLQRLVIDLDNAELLDDDLAPVLRRALAAARMAHVELVVRATRPGTRRWLARHELDEVKP